MASLSIAGRGRRGGGTRAPRAGAARAAHHAAGAGGPIGEQAHLFARGSAAAQLGHPSQSSRPYRRPLHRFSPMRIALPGELS